jgi:hypothetical protein
MSRSLALVRILPVFLSLGFALGLLLGQAFAAPPIAREKITFGTEPTFIPASGDIEDGDVEKMADAFQRITGGTRLKLPLTDIMGRFHKAIKIRTLDGATWTFHNDHGALETASDVIPAGGGYAATSAVFEAAKRIGLKAEYYIAGQLGGGGHIHIGRKIFDENPLLLRNLIVDLYNRPYIKAVLEEIADPAAPTITDRGREAEFRKRLAALDARFAKGETPDAEEVAMSYLGAIGSRFKSGDMKNITEGTRKLIYSLLPPQFTIEQAMHLPEIARAAVFRNMDARNMELNLINLFLKSPPTVEFRSPRSPKSAKEVDARLNFLEHYIQYLNTIDQPIEMKTFSTYERALLESPDYIRERWDALISLVGLEPAKYRYEWESRFPALLKVGEGSPKGSRLEVRFGRGNEFTIDYQFRVVSLVKPELKLAAGEQSFVPEFREVEKGVWEAVVKIPTEDGEVQTVRIEGVPGSKFNAQGLEGTRKLWNGFLGRQSHRNRYRKCLAAALEAAAEAADR